MAQAPRSLDPGRSARHQFGAELRRLRLARGLSQAGLARLVHVSPDLVAKVEKAERWPSKRLVDAWDDVLGTDRELTAIWPEVERERYATAESSAAAAIPVDSELASHWTRTLAVLTKAENALGVHGLMDLTVRELQLLSRQRRAAGDPLKRRFASVEARWLEFASWVADNDGNPRQAAQWLQQAYEMADHDGDEVLRGYVLTRQAQRAAEAGDAAAAIALAAGAGQSSRRLPPRIQALSMVRAAQAHALDGDAPATWTRLRAAYRLLDQTSTDAESETLTSHCCWAYVAAHEARCRLLLGDHAQAIDGYRDALASWPAGHRLDEGLFRAQLTVAYDRAGRLEEAETEGLRALDLARQTGSHRTLRALAERRSPTPRGATHDQLHHAWPEQTAPGQSQPPTLPANCLPSLVDESDRRGQLLRVPANPGVAAGIEPASSAGAGSPRSKTWRPAA